MTVSHTPFHSVKARDPKEKRAIVPAAMPCRALHLPAGEVEAAVAYAARREVRGHATGLQNGF